MSSKHVPTLLTGIFHTVGRPQKLRFRYKKILLLLKKIPEETAYRKYTESIICHRLAVVDEAGDDKKEIEENLNNGTIEILLRQADDELRLVEKMILWKAWEPLAEAPPAGQWDWPPVYK